jgi:HSA
MQRSNNIILPATGEAFVAEKDAISTASYQELLERQDEIQRRIKVIAVEPVKAKKPNASGSSTAGAAKSSSNYISRRNGAKRKKTEGSDDHEQQKPFENQVPVLEKNTDVHWDFTMKEMMWLATDFQAERKRQMSLAKKIAAAIRQYHKTRESRQLRELAEAELKRRRLAGRIGREVRGWWTKIERVIAYKQKCSADEERREAMNKQLVTLVKQTEKYTESLIRLPKEHDDEGSEASVSSSDGSEGGESSKKSNGNRQHQQRRKKRRKPYSISIEEALAIGERSRRSKKKVVDYNRLHLEAGDGQLYGESTASDTGSDNSYSPDDGDEWVDDESTLLEAEAWETKERLLEQQQLQLLWNGSAPTEIVDTSSFAADPRELRALREERDMPIEDVLKRYRAEAEASESASATEEVPSIAAGEAVKETGHHGDDMGESIADAAPDGQTSEAKVTGGLETKGEPGEDGDASTEEPDVEANNSGPRKQSAKRVSFALSSNLKNTRATSADGSAKYDADDDGDASDVEDFVYLLDAKGANGVHDEDDDASEEFEADQNEVDDETTIEQEEHLPQEMSPEQEISLLKAENEMSIEELRKMYAGVLQTPSFGNVSTGATHSEATTHGTTNAANENATTQEATTTDAHKGNETHDDASMDPEAAISNVKGSCDGSEMFGADVDDADDDARRATEEHNGWRGEKHNGGGSSLLVAMVDAEDEDNEDEDEFEPDGDAPPDDETTMEAEERLGREMSYEDEISLLNKENEMSIEELRAKYLGAVDIEYSNPANGKTTMDAAGGTIGIAALVDGGSGEGESEDPEDDTEFVAEGDDVDDETTMEAEERLGREMSPEEELAMLQRESETPIESLYELYQKMEAEMDSADEDSASAVDETEGMKRTRQPLLEDEEDANRDTKRAKKDEEFADEGMAAIEALEKSAERARRTLASRPFLLAPWVRLREYQQTGLNWLVSLQTRRLNGILADGKNVSEYESSFLWLLKYDFSLLSTISDKKWDWVSSTLLRCLFLPGTLTECFVSPQGKRCKRYPCWHIWLRTRVSGALTL